MTTQAQDTHPQDPIDAYTLHIEEMRRRPVPSGLAGLVHLLFVEFFTFLFRWMAEIAERNRKGTLPEVAPVAAREPRAWPDELSPRESGWLERRGVETAWSGATMHGPLEQPEAPRRQQVVEQPKANVKRRTGGCVFRPCGWHSRSDLKKWVLGDADKCADIVTI